LTVSQTQWNAVQREEEEGVPKGIPQGIPDITQGHFMPNPNETFPLYSNSNPLSIFMKTNGMQIRKDRSTLVVILKTGRVYKY
jgi:hypothetical protein